MNFEHNCIRKAGTDPFWYATGTTTYTGGYNTLTTDADNYLDLGNTDAMKDTDQHQVISWNSLKRDLTLPVNATHYRSNGAAMMAGWYRPREGVNLGAYARKPIYHWRDKSRYPP
jgi:hypothetical protein